MAKAPLPYVSMIKTCLISEKLRTPRIMKKLGVEELDMLV
jgi:hypothetical protein